MSGDKLTPLQRRILRVLAGLTPPWTLTGGGALAGIHLGHRETRDLDLFWRNRGELGTLVAEAVPRLAARTAHGRRRSGIDASLAVQAGGPRCSTRFVPTC